MKEEVTEFIYSHKENTDIFCFQEAFNTTCEICQELLPNYEKITANKTPPKDDDFSLATYVNKKYPIKKTDVILQDSLTEGLGLYTQIEWDKNIVNICNFHGVSRPGSKLDTPQRITQSQTLIKYFQNLEGVKIIGGDFNLDINSESVNMFSNNNYRNLIVEYKIPSTRNRIAWEKYPTSVQYHSDYVFTNVWYVNDFEVLNNEISDHLPMVLTI